MAMPIRILVDQGGLPRKILPGDGSIGMPTPTPLTTVGAGTILAADLTTGLIHRTGSTAAYTDTTDTGGNLDSEFPQMGIGESFSVIYNNDVAFAATIAGGAGVTLQSSAGNAVVPASSSKNLLFIRTGVGTYNLYVL